VGGCLLQKYNWIGGCTLNEKFIAMLSCFQWIKTLHMPKENHSPELFPLHSKPKYEALK
jgi:hypothetical protein